MNTPFPMFCVMAVARDDSRVTLRGSVSFTRVGRETWVGDRHVGYLKLGTFLASGRWHAGGDCCGFVLDRSEHLSELDGTPTLEVLDGYWGERAELVLDESVTWSASSWTDAADHAHCAICCTTVSTQENREHFAAGRGDRLCAACYRNYVSKRALGFIPSAAQHGDAAGPPPVRG